MTQWSIRPPEACARLKDKNICSFSCIITNLTLLFTQYTYCSFPYKPSKASGDLHTKKLSVGCTSLHVSCHFDVQTFTWDCTLLTGLQFGPGAIGLWLFTFLYRGAQVVNVLKKARQGDQTFSYLLSLSRNKWLSARALPSSCINTLFSLSKKVACIAVWR